MNLHSFARPFAAAALAGAALGTPPPAAAAVPPAGLTMHVEMEAVVLADDDGGNPPGVLTLKQLRTWIRYMNESMRNAGANIAIDFAPARDLAHVRNSAVNRLDHDSNAPAAKLAAKYPGRMVVFFRAYGPAGTGVGVTGNGYTAYNPYVPVGSAACKTGTESRCSASYTVMPSVYCGTTVATDLVKKGKPNGPLGPDVSGCGITNDQWYVYQNFSQLAHEGGHYLGLPHTFPGSYDFLSTPQALQSWYQGTPRAGVSRGPAIYDGDSPGGPLVSDGTNLMTGWSFTVRDTNPDSGAHLYTDNNVSMCDTESKTLRDSSGASVVFDRSGYTLHATYAGKHVNVRFTPPKDDVMSYFMCKRPMRYSPSQATTMRTVLALDPQRNYLLCTNPRDTALWRYLDCTGKTGYHPVVLQGGSTPPPSGVRKTYSHYYR